MSDDHATPQLGRVEGWPGTVEEGPFVFDEDDLLLYAMLNDAVYMPELLWRDPQNHRYGGCYRVRPQQYRLNRIRRPNSHVIIACARAVGKTESEKIHGQMHAFSADTQGQKMLLTAPELIHLLPLTTAIEDNIRSCRLTMELLDTRNQQTGFTHRPFGVKFIDGTEIIGRIPQRSGAGVKGQHEPFLIVEEGQDYPDRGWAEVNETVNYDATDREGRPAFRFWIFGVHGGHKGSGFDERARSHVWRKIQVTQLMRPDWNADRKANAVASYGGSSSPDYRRNILGEPGAGASQYFVTARVMACVDQKVSMGEIKGSDYNETGYVAQTFRAEELDSLGMDIVDLLDLPEGLKHVWGGLDIGLTDSPSVLSIFADNYLHQRRERLALVRRFTLERFRPKTIRRTLYALAWHFGEGLKGMGVDVTGLGMPIWQDMEDDEIAPPRLLEVTDGYTFNSKVEVGVDRSMVTKDNSGLLRDQYGNMVAEKVNELTGETYFVVMMPFIAASTRYVREEVDSGHFLLPFDTEVTADMLGETKQRVENIGRRTAGEPGAAKKGDRFHILDSFRAAIFRRASEEIVRTLAEAGGQQEPVLETTLD